MNNQPYQVAVSANRVVRTFREGNETIEVLRGVTLNVAKGEVVAIVGSSGSGKSTLMHCLGGLDAIDGGVIEIDGEDLALLNEKAKGKLRNGKLGFVYQFHHLLPEFSALENVAMPLRIRRINDTEALAQAQQSLKAMGLEHRLHHLPSQMSGGERQRTAIARAMVTNPVCILADEPTGNLDHDTAVGVFEHLMAQAKNRSVAIVIVTHDLELAAKCDRILHLVDGVIA